MLTKQTIEVDETFETFEQKKVLRTRNWHVISYVPFELLEKYCKQDFIDRYALIYHDKDLEDDGTLKIPHTHIIVTFRNARTFSSIEKDFKRYKRDTNQNSRYIPVKDLNKELRYLIHIDNKDKYQYSITNVVTNRENLLNLFEENEVNLKVEQLIDDINNVVTLRTMVRRYGRDFIINFQKYTAFAQLLYMEERNLNYVPGCEIPCEISTASLEKKLSTEISTII